jgi:hypothetical protein|tara:strand:- start:197 stop:541 length:345 start_codon:yes stop_codon:yes gene_type:complete
MPTEATGIIDVVQELGTSASALIFFAWLIIFILKQHDKEKTQLRHDAEKKDEMMMEERKLYLAADAKNDEELRQYMKTSNSELMSIMSATNVAIKDMTIAVNNLGDVINRELRR